MKETFLNTITSIADSIHRQNNFSYLREQSRYILDTTILNTILSNYTEFSIAQIRNK